MIDENELTLYGRIVQIEAEIKRLSELTHTQVKSSMMVNYQETSEEREAKLANMKADSARLEALRTKEEKVKHSILNVLQAIFGKAETLLATYQDNKDSIPLPDPDAMLKLVQVYRELR